MTTKVCHRCDIDQLLENFHNQKRSKDGKQDWCKTCKSEVAQQRHIETYIPHPDELTLNCIECGKHRSETKYWNGKYCKNCYETIRRKNDDSLRIKINKRNAVYRANNKEKRCAYENNRLKTNPSARLANRFRNWVNKLIERKSGNAETLIGCNYDELKAHIESLWEPNMTWDNWGCGEGKWQIDHIEALLSFDLTDPQQQKDAFRYTNLQPLWKEDHDSKTKEDLKKHRKPKKV